MYAKYFKMLKYGLPVGACKIKMTAEGVDPSVRLLKLNIITTHLRAKLLVVQVLQRHAISSSLLRIN
jgi:hypothetical protein